MAISNKLTARGILQLSKEGYHNDGAGLYLRITKTGSKSWIFRFKRNGKSTDMGLGSFPAISLAEARRLSVLAREKLASNINPLQSKRKEQTTRLEQEKTTFRFCAEQYIESQRAEWKNKKHSQQWSNTLSHYAFPIIGEMPVAEVDTKAIENILNPIWLTKNETASRLRGRIERVLAWAKVKGYRSGENPAIWRGHLDKLLAKPSKVQKVKHHTAIPFTDVSMFIMGLQKQTGVASIALEMTILTACRTNEVLGARWDEFNLENAIWTIPDNRMKMGKEHKVPLSDRAAAIIRNMLAIRTCELVFPSKNGEPLSNMAMPKAIKRLGYDCTVHGMRSTFRDWASETTNFSNQVCEMALAHAIGNAAEAAYRRGDLLEKRRKLMQDWANYLIEVNQNEGENKLYLH